MVNMDVEPWKPRQETIERLIGAIPHAQALLGIKHNLRLPHLEMSEFPISDQWSQLMRIAIEIIASMGSFDKGKILGLGIGDGRNERKARLLADQRGNPLESIIGVDIDPGKLALAHYNLQSDEPTGLVKVDLYKGSAPAFLQDWHSRRGNPFDGTAFICLPQALGTEEKGTTSDIITPGVPTSRFAHFTPFALDLNADTLGNLAKISAKTARALLVLSGRIPGLIREQLIEETGWKNNGIVAQGRVRQDLDTPLGFMAKIEGLERIAKGGLFFDEEGRSLSVAEALDRHHQGIPVFHDVFVYFLGRR